MADYLSRQREHEGAFAGHPDVAEMRERYAKVLNGPRAAVIDGLILLSGLYLAISPWLVRFHTANANIAINNLILGLSVAVIGLGFAVAPERLYKLSWVPACVGIWMIISPWVYGGALTRTLVSNIVVGAVMVFLGLVASGMLMVSGRRRRKMARAQHA
jgi:hypothetical protein